MRHWICLWEWRYEASAHSASRHVITTEAKYMEMELSDLSESLNGLERTERTARRALGGAHPETAALEKSLQNARAALGAREKLYRKAIELDSNNAAAHNNLGLLMQTVRKDYDDAEQHYREAIELDPKHAWAHYNLGWLLHDVRKEYDGAEKLYRKAIELDPSNASDAQGMAHYRLGLLLDAQGRD
jgi:tetratricopeptide (TPR) repeat protein